MSPPDTASQGPAGGPDGTDELPVLDVAAYEAAHPELKSAASEPEPPAPQPPPPAADSELMSEVERWIVKKTEQLRAQQAELRAAKHEHNAGAARAGALSRELGATSANVEALKDRARILEQELARERADLQRRAAELDQVQHDVSRLGEELTAARAAEARQSAALAASRALLQERSQALEALQTTHAGLVADGQRVAGELLELERRVQESETRERQAQQATEAQSRHSAELGRRMQDETRMRIQVTAEREHLRAQLASCLERLQNREAYRSICESAIGELDEELASGTVRARQERTRADQLAAELQACERRLQAAVRERDEARGLQAAALAQRALDRGASEQLRGALESRLAELTAEHDSVRAQLAALEATLADTRRRAEAEALANRTVAERVRDLEAAISSRESELASARLELTRGRESLTELTGALEHSRTQLAEQSRLLEERESEARTAAASHAELVARSAALQGEIEELTGRLAAPIEERDALAERVVALTQEATQSDARLMRLESMNAELRATVKRLYTSLAERDAELQRGTADAAAGGETQASILTRIDGGRNHSFVLRSRTTIGRNPDNHLSLALTSVSRHHAVLIPAFRSAFLQDLGSTNGVMVNKRRVRCVRLEHGDVITLGTAQFRYTVAPVPMAAASGNQAAQRRRAHW
jgi:chromosome segregation ATPase